MTISLTTRDASARSAAAALLETRAAFDSVAADYHGPRGNNSLIQDMRQEMWRWLNASFPRAGHLPELGCGTGLDAVRIAEREHHITATDLPPLMASRAYARTELACVSRDTA